MQWITGFAAIEQGVARYSDENQGIRPNALYGATDDGNWSPKKTLVLSPFASITPCGLL